MDLQMRPKPQAAFPMPAVNFVGATATAAPTATTIAYASRSVSSGLLTSGVSERSYSFGEPIPIRGENARAVHLLFQLLLRLRRRQVCSALAVHLQLAPQQKQHPAATADSDIDGSAKLKCDGQQQHHHHCSSSSSDVRNWREESGSTSTSPPTVVAGNSVFLSDGWVIAALGTCSMAGNTPSSPVAFMAGKESMAQ
ncbi:nuclear pore complex protein Nup153 [Drosophila madeirensis]